MLGSFLGAGRILNGVEAGIWDAGASQGGGMELDALGVTLLLVRRVGARRLTVLVE